MLVVQAEDYSKKITDNVLQQCRVSYTYSVGLTPHHSSDLAHKLTIALKKFVASFQTSASKQEDRELAIDVEPMNCVSGSVVQPLEYFSWVPDRIVAHGVHQTMKMIEEVAQKYYRQSLAEVLFAVAHHENKGQFTFRLFWNWENCSWNKEGYFVHWNLLEDHSNAKQTEEKKHKVNIRSSTWYYFRSAVFIAESGTHFIETSLWTFCKSYSSSPSRLLNHHWKGKYSTEFAQTMETGLMKDPTLSSPLQLPKDFEDYNVELLQFEKSVGSPSPESVLDHIVHSLAHHVTFYSPSEYGNRYFVHQSKLALIFSCKMFIWVLQWNQWRFQEDLWLLPLLQDCGKTKQLTFVFSEKNPFQPPLYSLFPSCCIGLTKDNRKAQNWRRESLRGCGEKDKSTWRFGMAN